ncbi:4-hydroxyphenylpyruvate dioxygenase [Hahella aquimaris]|uniref:4-hydroxyphenylpyruvate dioxygenase n=1 Tax=Hahella sp. HNIBRBA332 TaxID=3015983 RepID=UPI00273BA04A|nr:4-hydroxyphenylpyruvate dioxygenase [Hahella sp. HNIBRBA332]WLQ12295.1 4-hydroxyphenylpyruvate dioxygenase [Hahella sp. HNIBRBA332]
MSNVYTNPLGTDGFEFVEFGAPDKAGAESLKPLFETLGFTAIAKHKRKAITLYRQGDINFLVNENVPSYFHKFSMDHGPCACAMAFRVKDAQKAFEYAVSQGAKPFDQGDVQGEEVRIPAVYGIGGSVLYFVDKYGEDSIYDIDFEYFPGVDKHPKGLGLTTLDHLTHNVFRGNMDTWAGFYERIGNFREIRYFDIEGKLTGLHSRAMTSPCCKIRIPINESADDKSQIEEYLQEYKGEGIQHIALSTEDIYKTVRDMREAGVVFMDTPDTYYEKIDARVPGHDENVENLKDLRILIDGAPHDNDGLLLQIFTSTVIGPIFFEIIQRKGNEGFGEGNFQALFESIEEDQIRRGLLSPNAGEKEHA